MSRASLKKAQARMLRETQKAETRAPQLADLPRPDWVRGVLSDDGWLVFASLWDERLAALGRRITRVQPDGTHEVIRPGLDEGVCQFGLEGVVRGLGRAPRREWPEMIQHHLNAILSILMADALAPRTENVRVRLSSQFGPEQSLEVLAPGLTVVLVNDLPLAVSAMLQPADVAAALGLPLAQLRERAEKNLREALRPRLRNVGGGDFDIFEVEVEPSEQGSYGASGLLALTPADFAAAGVDPLRGALVAVPAQDTCAVAPIPRRGVAALITRLASATLAHHNQAVRPLFDHLLWWQEGRLLPIWLREIQSANDVVLAAVVPPTMANALGADAEILGAGLALDHEAAA